MWATDFRVDDTDNVRQRETRMITTTTDWTEAKFSIADDDGFSVLLYRPAPNSPLKYEVKLHRIEYDSNEFRARAFSPAVIEANNVIQRRLQQRETSARTPRS